MNNIFLRSKISVKNIFSLMELLVVIAIIVILSSMLLPALNNVRGMAKKITCMNKLKGFGVATSMYQQDNNGYFTFWWEKFDSYLPVDSDDVAISESASPSAIENKRKRMQILHCPENSYFGNHRNGYIYMTDYALNYYLAGMRKSDTSTPVVTVSMIKKASTIAWITDCNINYFTSSIIPWDYGGARHQRGMNIIYADTHANWKTSRTSAGMIDSTYCPSIFPVK